MGLILSTVLTHVVWPLYVHGLLPASFYVAIFLLVTSLFGIDTGLHKRYVQLLLKLFDFCHRSVKYDQEIKRKLWARRGTNAISF